MSLRNRRLSTAAPAEPTTESATEPKAAAAVESKADLKTEPQDSAPQKVTVQSKAADTPQGQSVKVPAAAGPKPAPQVAPARTGKKMNPQPMDVLRPINRGGKLQASNGRGIPGAAKSGKRKKILLLSAAAFVVLLLFAGGTYGGLKFRQSRQPKPKTASDTDAIERAKSLAGINTSEVPVTLTVTDKSKLDQPFLAAAENGDKVLLYYQAKKAVVYRPGTDTLVKSGNFAPPAPAIFLREGTKGDTVTSFQTLLKPNRDYVVKSSDKSTNTGYTETLIVDVSGHYPGEAQKLADLLKGKIANLPPGENPPEADFLVITAKPVTAKK